MRRFLPVFVLFASLALVAATAAPRVTPHASPSPSPSASVSPRASATPFLAPFSEQPVVIVYPFDVQTGVDPKIGIDVAEILRQAMTQAGGLDVLTVPKGVLRPDFLRYARAQHADFYIGGYVTPVGDVAAVVEQVVSTQTGIILFSQTAQVSSVPDVASQGLLARAQILAFEGRDTQTIASQSSTPAPSATNGAQVKLGGIGSFVSSVFHHKAGPTPSPTPAVKPARGVFIAPVTAAKAPVSPTDLTNATDELYFASNRYFTTRMTALKSPVAKSANAICGSQRDNTIATGTITRVPQKHHRTETVFVLQIYTCFGDVLYTETGKGGSIKQAVDGAVGAYAAAHPDNS